MTNREMKSAADSALERHFDRVDAFTDESLDSAIDELSKELNVVYSKAQELLEHAADRAAQRENDE